MARDQLELRRHAPTDPDDVLDPPRFGQLLETAKDAFVLDLRNFFRVNGFTTERRQEAPTVEKYAIGFGAGLDPYETFVQITQEFPDILERLPHVAVTAASGSNNRMTAGRPVMAATQSPPRVQTTLPGPYALAAAAAQTNDLTVAAPPPGTYDVTIDGLTTSVLVPAGTGADVLRAIAAALSSSVGELYRMTLLPSATFPTSLRLARRAIGEPFVLSVSVNLTSTLVTAASAAAEPDRIVYRTTPDRRNVVESQVIFAPGRFSTAAPVTAALAEDVARVWNEQSRFTLASVQPVGVGSGVRFATGGPAGGGMTPNEIEVLASSSRNAVAVLGLGNFGDAAPGDTIAGDAPHMTLNVVGAGFTAAMVGRYVTLTGDNAGRHLVESVTSPTQLGFYNEDGVAEALSAANEWFIGFRDDWHNIARPVQNRYHMSAKLQVQIDVMCEAPNTRREVMDLVWSYFTFFMEQKFFTIYGRGIFDEAYPDENYQISIGQEVSAGSEGDATRGDDLKNRIYLQRITVPITITHMLDRQVLVPYGPDQGESWVLEADNVTADDNLPMPS